MENLSSSGVTITNPSFQPGQPHTITNPLGKPIINAFDRSFVTGTITNNGKKKSPQLLLKVRIYGPDNNFIESSNFCSKTPNYIFTDAGTPLEPGQSRLFYCKIPEVSELSPYSSKDYRTMKIGKIEAVLNSVGGISEKSLGGSNEKIFTLDY